MTRMRVSILAGVFIATAIAVSGCGGSAAKPHAPATASPSSAGPASSTPAEPPPADYKWAGSATQGVWFAVPARWAAIDLAKVSASKALRRFAPQGASSRYLKSVLAELSRHHAFVVADLRSAARSPHKFATNGNAFCVPTSLAPNAGSQSALKAAFRGQYQKFHAHVLAIRNATIGGHPGVRSEFTLPTRDGIPITQTQYAALTSNSRLCTITLTTDRPAAFRRTFKKIGSTIHVS